MVFLVSPNDKKQCVIQFMIKWENTDRGTKFLDTTVICSDWSLLNLRSTLLFIVRFEYYGFQFLTPQTSSFPVKPGSTDSPEDPRNSSWNCSRTFIPSETQWFPSVRRKVSPSFCLWFSSSLFVSQPGYRYCLAWTGLGLDILYLENIPPWKFTFFPIVRRTLQLNNVAPP